jgi:uncharacterized protein YecT (DUF1311 family)
MRLIAILLLAMTFAGTSQAQEKLRAEDSRAVQDCIKTKSGPNDALEACIGVVANPCLDGPDGKTTVGQSECYQREQRVWDDILNETYRRLQGSFEGKLKQSLRDVQRAWIESRKLQCGFYGDVIKGTLAVPLAANCFNAETARRAIYLLSFLNI